jgi:uncharacterized RDD family membrane protein YckC
MRIAYLTTDEMNHDLARRTADGCEVALEIPALAELIPEGAYDSVLVDWDYLPAGSKPFVLAALFAGYWHGPVAVHGYDLEDKVRDILRQKGVAVHRRLEPRWLTRWLRRARRRVEGRRLARAEVTRIPAQAHAQRTVSPERRALREEKMTTTYPETDRIENRTPPVHSEDEGFPEVDWSYYQVSPLREVPRHPGLPRAEFPVNEPAGRIARMVAVLLDTLLLLLPWAVGLFFLGDTLDRPEISILHVRWVQLGTSAVAIGQGVLLALRGQTLGKMAVGVRVVRARDGRNPGLWRAVILRQLVPALVLWVCLPAEPVFYHVVFRHLVPGVMMTCLAIVGRFLAVVELLTFLKEDPRCLHDYLADTRVVEV